MSKQTVIRSGQIAEILDRIWALLADFLLLLSIIFVVGMVLDSYIFQRGRLDQQPLKHIDLIYTSGIIGISCAYFLLAELSAWQASLGKRLVGLKIVHTDGVRPEWWQIIIRVFLKIFLLGFAAALRFAAPLVLAVLVLIVYLHGERRAAHDLASGTKVVYR